MTPSTTLTRSPLFNKPGTSLTKTILLRADPDPLLLPDVPAIQAVASATGSEPVASTSSGDASAQPSALPQVDTAMKDLQEQLISHHANLVKMCQNVGIKDICSINQKSKLDTILLSIDPKDLTCKVCTEETIQQTTSQGAPEV